VFNVVGGPDMTLQEINRYGNECATLVCCVLYRPGCLKSRCAEGCI
jgi:hypothetical protein